MKKLCTLALTLLLVLVFIPAAWAANGDGHWADASISRCEGLGLLSGMQAGTANLDLKLPRGEMFKLMDNVMRYQQQATNEFTDLDSSYVHYDTVLKLVKAGVLTGYENGTIQASSPITREEAIVLFARMFHMEEDASAAQGFTDSGSIGEWAKPLVGAMKKAGYVQGWGGALHAKENITLGEITTILSNMLATVYNTPGTYSEGGGQGFIVVNASGVTLKDINASTNLLIAPGVGEGSVTLENVKVSQQLYLLGGGKNSVTIAGTFSAAGIQAYKDGDTMHIINRTGQALPTLNIKDNSAPIVLQGDFGTVRVGANANVTLDDAKAGKLEVTGEKAAVTVNSNAEASSMTIAAKEVKATVNGTVTAITTSGDNVLISGSGKVETVHVEKGEGVEVNVSGATITVSENAGPVKAGNTTIQPGTGEETSGGASTDGGGGGGTSDNRRNSTIGGISAPKSLDKAIWPTGSGATWEGMPTPDMMALDYQINRMTVTVTGTLNYVEDFIGFNRTEEEEQSGYYMLFEIQLPTANYNSELTLRFNNGEIKKVKPELMSDGKTYSLQIVKRVGGQFEQPQNFTLTIDWDGSGSTYRATVYTFDMSGVDVDNLMVSTAEPLTKDDLTTEKIWPADTWGAWGKDMPEGLLLANGNITVDGRIIKVNGDLSLTEYPKAFPEQPQGYYLALKLLVPLPQEELKKFGDPLAFLKLSGNTEKVKSLSQALTWRDGQGTVELILYVADKDAVKVEPFTITLDWDGVGTAHKAITYTLNLDKLKLHRLGESELELEALTEDLLDNSISESVNAKVWSTDTWGTWGEDMPKEIVLANAKFDYSEMNRVIVSGESVKTSYLKAYPDIPEGYFMTLRVIVPFTKAEADKIDGTILTVMGIDVKHKGASLIDWRGDEGAYELVLFLGKDGDHPKEDIQLIVDWDGNATNYQATAYLLDLSGITFQEKSPLDFEMLTTADVNNGTAGSDSAKIWPVDKWGAWGGDMPQEIVLANPDEENKVELDGTTIKLAGVLSQTQYAKAFPSGEDEGYYLAYRINVPEDFDQEKTEGTIITLEGRKTLKIPASEVEWRGDKGVVEVIFFLGKDEDDFAEKYTITVDWDGDGIECVPTKYTLDFGDVDFQKTSLLNDLEALKATDLNNSESGTEEDSKTVWPADTWGEWAAENGMPVEIVSDDLDFTYSGSYLSFAGTLNYAEYLYPTAFPENQQKGYYAAFRINVPTYATDDMLFSLEAADTGKALTIAYDELDQRGSANVVEIILFVSADEDLENYREFTLTVDWDGDDDEYLQKEYTFDFGKLFCVK